MPTAAILKPAIPLRGRIDVCHQGSSLLAALVLVCGLSLGVVPASTALAQSASMVEAGDAALRDDIQWLVDRGVIDLSVSSWPLPLAALQSAFERRLRANLSRGDRDAVLNIDRYLRRHARASTHGVTFQVNSDSVPSTGFATQARGRGTAGAYVSGQSDNIAGKLQVSYLQNPQTDKQSSLSLEGSYIAGTWAGQVIYAGQLARWWGPGQDGSLIWSNAGTAIPGVGFKRADERAFETPWLAWLGSWNYDLFMGQMQHDTAVARPRVFGLRLHARPVRGLEVGLSRVIQWGGEGRRNNLGALWDAISGNSNDQGIDRDPGNEIAGFDVRYTLSVAGNPLTVYGQFNGEDEAGVLPSKWMGLVGGQYKHMMGATRLHWYAEAADTMVGRLFGIGEGRAGTAYRHSVYTNGYYHDALPIGHFSGGSSRVYSAGLTVVPPDYRTYARYSFRVLQARVNESSQAVNGSFPEKDSFYGGEVAVSWTMNRATLRMGLNAIRGSRNNMNNAFGLIFGLQLPLDG